MTREKILAVSSRVFNERGYHGTTLADIASALRITKAALYYHVRNKEELLFESNQAVLDIALEGIARAVARASDPAEQLRFAIAHYIQGITEGLTGTIFEGKALSRAHRKHVSERRDAFEGQLRQIIQAGVETGAFVVCDPKLVGFALLGATNSVPKWFRPGGGCSGREVADTFSAYLVRGLQRRPAETLVPAGPPGADDPPPATRPVVAARSGTAARPAPRDRARDDGGERIKASS